MKSYILPGEDLKLMVCEWNKAGAEVHPRIDLLVVCVRYSRLQNVMGLWENLHTPRTTSKLSNSDKHQMAGN